ncbi:MAG: YaiI/YqxD family protein [Gammaproteobacteria bacterium]|nr:YaiI/YqxD family protein [Gammaproteobacteria bacterium]MDH5732142.1 YaiI/YqxD family protein [Gammaproteobacteria bacterium]
MNIWVDADACPKVIKEILFRAAKRAEIVTTFVANQSLTVPASPFLKTKRVAAGFDVADNEIVKLLEPGDLVVTQDIPLAAEAIAMKAFALNPRGEFYDETNIRQRLNMRDFMDNLRSSGIQTGGPAAFHPRDQQQFANALDRFIAKNNK